MSARQLVVIDFEVSQGGNAALKGTNAHIQNEPVHQTIILEVTGQGRLFVALEKTAISRRAHFTCIATNYEIMWVDELKVGPPALTWKHDFASGSIGDLSLHVCSQSGLGRSARQQGGT